MASIPTSVEDDFNFPQNESSNQPNAGWLPVGSNRQLIETGTSTNRIIGDRWVFIVESGAESAQINYLPAGGIISYDLSNLSTISLNDIIATVEVGATAEFTLELFDGTNPGISTKSFTNPIPNTIVWNIQTEFNSVILEEIIRVTFRITGGGDINLDIDGSAGSITSALICVAKDTKVLMADGSEKPIQNIQRGDYVANNFGQTNNNKVARIIHSKISPMTPISIITIEKDAICPNQPKQKIIMTSGHPILYNGLRYRAKCFKNFNGVKYHSKSKTLAKDILPPNEDGSYSLYNIQYEHDGYFIANGLIVDSIPPLSIIAPLPKELYFHKSLFFKPKKSKLPKLIKMIIDPSKK